MDVKEAKNRRELEIVFSSVSFLNFEKSLHVWIFVMLTYFLRMSSNILRSILEYSV